ncbi:EAL domain-containing protein [Motiliproteus coralliicola]|uniref:EAL domain-containing protein n=1 Tax=Motiliproteus coralliicola TaxID=2283196 RepID=A0A369WDG2_9GAMM|nr:EAL domain-containing protein [Motiliproteus coralliicola]RDE19687.1 EAL domain-containing protein [Motiliproteus coralliicola]
MIDTRQLAVPEQMLQHWQKTVDLIAEIAEIPASLVMRVHEQQIEVFATSHSDGNPYPVNEMANLNTGLYCETVIQTRQELLIPNALTDEDWNQNPDIELGMISYYGLPLNWPDGQPFGTLCMLDGKENHYNRRSKELLARFRETLEADLKILYQQHQLIINNQQLEQRVQQRTIELQKLNNRLASEIDRRNAAESVLEHNRRFDPLTGLPNRASLTETLGNMIQHYANSQQQLAVICLGPRNFKSVNHSYGHTIGDELLKALGQRLRSGLTIEHSVARGNGDEFLILLPCAASTDAAMQSLQQLTQRLSQAFEIDHHQISLSFNAGIAVAPSDSTEPLALLQKASAALAVAKEQDQPFCFFSQQTQAELDKRYQLESYVVDALRNEELSVHYQPVVSVQNQQVIGAEALLRWNNAQLGEVDPEQFIGIAEKTGQINEIGNFVLRSAIQQAKQWQDRLGRPFRIAINISPIQISDPRLVQQIDQLLRCYDLDPRSLELEVTEGVLLQDSYQAEIVLRQLRDLHVRVSLDDFGTGYSSLSYLQKYAFDTLKIDRSFITDSHSNAQDRELARAIIALARKLNLKVIAEGVETEQHHRFMQQENCDYGQGYWYGVPVPADTFDADYIGLSRTAH